MDGSIRLAVAAALLVAAAAHAPDVRGQAGGHAARVHAVSECPHLRRQGQCAVGAVERARQGQRHRARLDGAIATGINGEWLALSAKRNPHPGKLGVVEQGALADLLLVDGNPLENIDLIADPAKN